MTHTVSLPLACAFLLGGAALAQGVPLGPSFTSVDRSFEVDTFAAPHDVAVGRYVQNHPGLGVIVLDQGGLTFSFQPAVTTHFVDASPSGVTVHAIATLDVLDDETDLLVAVVSDVGDSRITALRYTEQGFVEESTATLSGWGGIDRLRVCRAAGDALLVAGCGTGGLRVARFRDSIGFDPITHSASSHPLFDIDWVDWDEDGIPDLAMQSATGIVVVDAAFQVLDQFAFPGLNGICRSSRDGGVLGDTLTGVVESSPGQCIPFAVRDGEPAYVSFPGVTLSAGLAGGGVGDVNGDAVDDVMITCVDGRQYCLSGQSISVTPDLQTTDDDAGAGDTAVVVADIDDDGRADAVWVSPTAGSLRLLLQEEAPASATSFASGGFLAFSGGGVDLPDEVTLNASLGVEEQPAYNPWLTPEGGSPDLYPGNVRMRVRLPGVPENEWLGLLVTTWYVPPELLHPQGFGELKGVPEGNFLYSLPVNAGHAFDVSVPVREIPEFQGGMYQPGDVTGYFFETRLVRYQVVDGEIEMKPLGKPMWSLVALQDGDEDPLEIIDQLLEALGNAVVFCLSYLQADQQVDYDPNYAPTDDCSRHLGGHTAVFPDAFVSAGVSVPAVDEGVGQADAVEGS